MNVITEAKKDSKVVVFEPGNATRYYFTLTQTSKYNMVAVDMNNHKVVEFPAGYTDSDIIQISFLEKGYSVGDAKPIAEFLSKAVRESAYITYRHEYKMGGTELRTVWFKDNPQAWEENLVSIGEQGFTIVDRGFLNWEPSVTDYK
jgi:nicotinamide mononucleotide adenylyltransferase